MKNNKIRFALEKINQEINTKDEILLTLKDICNEFDIQDFSLFIFYGAQNIQEEFFTYNTYPEAWVNYIIEEKKYLYSPLFSCLKKSAMPFEWHTTSFQDLTFIQQNYMNVASDYGIKWGETIPLIPHSNYHGFITIPNSPSLQPEILYTIQYIANICADRLFHILNYKGLDSLTKREIEVLTLRSQGLPIKKISNSLNLSNSTTFFHLKNIRDKLGVPSTEQAIVKFTAFGDETKH